jgi:hypothetical protein
MKIDDVISEAGFWSGVAKGLGSPQLAKAIDSANAASTGPAPVDPQQSPTEQPAATPPVNYDIPAYKRQGKTIPGVTPPAPATAEPAVAAAPTVADQQSKVGVGQINKIIPTLRTRDLNSVKKTVDATLAKKAQATPAPAVAPATPAAPQAQPVSDEPVRIGGQKLDPNNPTDAKILQKIQSQQVAEGIDLAEVLWRKMKSKR